MKEKIHYKKYFIIAFISACLFSSGCGKYGGLIPNVDDECYGKVVDKDGNCNSKKDSTKDKKKN